MPCPPNMLGSGPRVRHLRAAVGRSTATPANHAWQFVNDPPPFLGGDFCWGTALTTLSEVEQTPPCLRSLPVVELCARVHSAVDGSAGLCAPECLSSWWKRGPFRPAKRLPFRF